MPLLTRRRIAGLYLGARLAGLAVLPAIVLALPGRNEVMSGLPQIPAGAVMDLVSHAGAVVVWEGALSPLWLAAEDGVRQVMDALAPLRSDERAVVDIIDPPLRVRR